MRLMRTLLVALLGYTALLAAPAATARDRVEISLPGINLRLPAPPHPPLPHISIEPDRYERRPAYGYAPPPRYYREEWRYEGDYRPRHHHHHRHDRWERDDWRDRRGWRD